MAVATFIQHLVDVSIICASVRSVCCFYIAAPFTNMFSCPPVVSCAPPPSPIPLCPPVSVTRDFAPSASAIPHPVSHPVLRPWLIPTHYASIYFFTPSPLSLSPSSSWFIVLFSFILAIFDAGLSLIQRCRQITLCSLCCIDGVILKAQHTLSGAKHLFVHIIQFL